MHIDRTHSIVFPFNHLVPRCGLGCNFQYSRSSFLNLLNLLGIGWGKKEKVSNKNIQMYIFPTTYHWESLNHDLKLGTYSQDSLHFYLHILMCFFLRPCIYSYDQHNKISFLFIKVDWWFSSYPSPSYDLLCSLGTEEVSRKKTLIRPGDTIRDFLPVLPSFPAPMGSLQQYIKVTCKYATLNIILGNFSVHPTDETVLFNNTLVPTSRSKFRSRKSKVSNEVFIPVFFFLI